MINLLFSPYSKYPVDGGITFLWNVVYLHQTATRDITKRSDHNTHRCQKPAQHIEICFFASKYSYVIDCLMKKELGERVVR
jgi:hypothetical protein